MRTDVKLGLAVGSILFSVVLVYVLFFTSGTRVKAPTTPNGNNEVAAKPADSAGPSVPAVSPTAAPPVAAAVAPEPVVSITPTTQPSAAAPAASNLSIYTPGNALTPFTPAPAGASAAPADSAAPAAASSGPRSWQALLDGGANSELVARSETPMLGGVRGNGGTPADAAAAVPSTPIPASPAEVSPSTQPSTAVAQTHRVKPGETFWSIARDVYGNAAYHSVIAKANPKVDPSRLRAGTLLVLPGKSELPAPVSAAPAVLAAATAAPTTQPVDSTRQYRVRPNDNLNTICKRLYGNTARVAQLYEMNKSRIGPNPSNLKLGMVLVLPETPTRGTPASTTPAPGGPAAPASPLTTTMN